MRSYRCASEQLFIPSFIFKWLKNTSGTGQFRYGQRPKPRVQDGLKRYWLCRICEDKLNVWATKFATGIFHPFNNGITDTAGSSSRGFFQHQSNQNRYFNANCMILGSSAVRIWPN